MSEARSGDACAFGRLVDVANDDLMAAASGVLRRSTRRWLPAEEVFSEAMLAAMRDFGTLRATNYIGFRYWFASIARNHVLRKLRLERARRASKDEAQGLDEDECEVGLSLESLAFLRCAVSRLTRGQRIAFVLREGFALTWRSIGFVLERREAPAARLVHYRAVQNVKDLASSRPDLRLFLATIQV